MRNPRWRHGLSIGMAVALCCCAAATAPAAAATSAFADTSPSAVADALVYTPSDARDGMQKAINLLGTSSSAAAGLVSLFAAQISDTAACDADQAKALAQALQSVLSDPANAALTTQPAVAQIQAQIVSFAGNGQTASHNSTNLPDATVNGSNPSTGGGTLSSGSRSAPPPPAGAFGSFGSATGSGVATSPAS